MSSHFESIFFYMFLALLTLEAGCSHAQTTKCKSCRSEPLIELAAVGRDIAGAVHAEDERKSFSEITRDNELQKLWPGADSQSLSGVQTLYCQSAEGRVTQSTVTFACDRKTIITSAHAILDGNSKIKWGEQGSDCFVGVKDRNGKHYKYSIKKPSLNELEESGQIGTRYPSGVGGYGSDWVVLQLEGLVPESQVVPFKLADYSSPQQAVGIPLVTAGSWYWDLEHEAYQICENTRYATVREVSHFENNCNGNIGGGSGGPGLAIQDNKPLIAAVTSRNINGNTARGITAPISSALKAAVIRASGDSSCAVPLEAPVSSAQGS